MQTNLEKQIIKKVKIQLISVFTNKPSSDIEDYMPAFSTSFIKVNLTKSQAANDNRIINSISNKDEIIQEYKQNLKKYNAAINILPDFCKTIIEERYIKFQTFENIANKLDIDIKKIWEYINKAYLLLALYDQNIDYSINDYIQSKLQVYSFQHVIKMAVLYELKNTYLNDISDNKRLVKIIENTLNINLMNYIFMQERINLSKKEKRAIYVYAFLSDQINFEANEFIKLMQKTGQCRKLIDQILNLKN